MAADPGAGPVVVAALVEDRVVAALVEVQAEALIAAATDSAATDSPCTVP